MLLSAIGGVGMWSVVVALPAVQAEFGADARRRLAAVHADHDRLRRRRRDHGRLADRVGIVLPVLIGAVSLGVGYVLASMSGGLWQFAAGLRLADRHVRHAPRPSCR